MKKQQCSLNKKCLGFSYSMFSPSEFCIHVVGAGQSTLVLRPSVSNIVLVKSLPSVFVDDRSLAPNSIIIDVPYFRLWSSENLNGLFEKVNDTFYRKRALYDDKSMIILEKLDTWQIVRTTTDTNNVTAFDDSTVLVMTNSSAQHPGLIQFDNAEWKELEFDDLPTFDRLPGRNDTYSNYTALSGRNRFKFIPYYIKTIYVRLSPIQYIV